MLGKVLVYALTGIACCYIIRLPFKSITGTMHFDFPSETHYTSACVRGLRIIMTCMTVLILSVHDKLPYLCRKLSSNFFGLFLFLSITGLIMYAMTFSPGIIYMGE